MSPRKNAKFYLDQEIESIEKKWKEDKALIDERMKGEYPQDIDREYQKYLNNKNLQTLFKHAAYLYRGALVSGELHLYKNEESTVLEVYNTIIKQGYYSKSKEEEKSVRAHFGKAVSRQTNPNRKR